MSREQVKGTLLTVGATAASTALLVGGFVGYNHMQRATATSDAKPGGSVFTAPRTRSSVSLTIPISSISLVKLSTRLL